MVAANGIVPEPDLRVGPGSFTSRRILIWSKSRPRCRRARHQPGRPRGRAGGPYRRRTGHERPRLAVRARTNAALPAGFLAKAPRCPIPPPPGAGDSPGTRYIPSTFGQQLPAPSYILPSDDRPRSRGVVPRKPRKNMVLAVNGLLSSAARLKAERIIRYPHRQACRTTCER